MNLLRWGILAPGRIAEGFVRDLHASGAGKAVACGSRSHERSKAFAQRFGLERAWGSYAELLADPEVDAVYIASPHNHHLEHALAAFQAGKPVLCEKPLTLNTAQARRLFTAAESCRLFVMEALWTYWLPAHRQVSAWLKAGRIGEPRLVQADFGFAAPFDPEGRLFDPALAGGALLDVGVYTVSMVQSVFGNAEPSVQANAHLGVTGIDETTIALLEYPGGARAQISCSLRHELANEARIYGTKGSIRVPLFWRATDAFLECESGNEAFHDPRTTGGYEFEALQVTEALRHGRREDTVLTKEFSLRLAATLDTIRRDIGLVYPGEA